MGKPNILLNLSHSIEEYDQLRLFHSLGYGVASIGGYIDPASPHTPMRPALPEIPVVESIKQAIDAQGTDDNLGNAQSWIPDAALEWLGDDGVIIFHHHLFRLFGQWPRIRDWLNGSSRRRVIWRSVGQSVANNEDEARPFRSDGLERVAYSPKEANIPGYTGHDVLIRFYKDPTEYGGWTGENPVVLNIAQHNAEPHARDVWINWRFWELATAGLPTVFAGTHTEKIGGLGQVSHDEMHRLLRTSRVYLYTGTQPASYTLGLIEAMMTGIPVLSIAPHYMRIFEPYGPDLFEGHEIVGSSAPTIAEAQRQLNEYVSAPCEPDCPHPLICAGVAPKQYEFARAESVRIRQRAIDLFGRDKIAAEWKAFLG